MLKEIKNTAVHLPTQEQYNEYMQMCEDIGWVWATDKEVSYANHWTAWEENTYCKIHDGFSVNGISEENKVITLQELKQKLGMMKFKQGDILVDKDGGKRKILGLHGEVYFLSTRNDFQRADGIYTHQELDKSSYKLFTEEEVKLVVTMNEIANKFDVDVKDLKIKK